MRLRDFLFLALCLCCACIDNRTAGPSTEEGNPQIVAVVVSGDNRPVADVPVIVFLVPANIDTAAQPGSAIGVASARTDAQGSCFFRNLPPGRYSIAAIDSAGNSAAIEPNVVVSTKNDAANPFSCTLALAATGSINGTVTRNGVPGNNQNAGLKDAFIQVKIGEIDRSYTTGPDGFYSFSNLPAGVYTLYFYASDGFYCANRKVAVAASWSGTVVDTVILTPVARLVPPKGLRAAYDTSAGIVRLSWLKVQFDSLRWYEVERIDLAGALDTTTTCSDTLFSDTVGGIPAGTILDYVVRSVDRAFNRSANAGPVEITVAR